MLGAQVCMLVSLVRILQKSICNVRLQFVAPNVCTLEIYRQQQYGIFLMQWISLKCTLKLHNFFPLFPLVQGSNSNNTISFPFFKSRTF